MSARTVVYLSPSVTLFGARQALLALVRALGIRLVRHTMYWYQIENTDAPGVYDGGALAAWDDLVRRCNEQGVILEVVVHGNAPGVSYADGEDGYRRFARFMGDMAEVRNALSAPEDRTCASKRGPGAVVLAN